MKKSIMLCVFSIWGSINLFSQTDSIVFSYPFNIGDDTWQEYKTNQERVAALQIPELILQTISTKDLLELCLNYPFLLEYTFCDDFQVGLNKLIKCFNGFEELLKRTDLIESMLNKDKNLRNDIQSILGEDTSKQGLFSFQNLALELLFFNEHIQKGMTNSQKEEFLSIYKTNKQVRSNIQASLAI